MTDARSKVPGRLAAAGRRARRLALQALATLRPQHPPGAPDTPVSVLLQQLRWMSVLCQVFILVTMFEPARNAALYPSSWAWKVAKVSAFPEVVFIAWFVLAIGLCVPLLVGLVLFPRSAFTRNAVSFNAVGAFLGAIGYAFICTAVIRWDAPGQVIAGFAADAILLVGGSLTMACWKNARHVQTFMARHAAGAQCNVWRA